MPINLYSKDSVDDLLDAKLSISSLSNAATVTLNAGVPTAGQALTYDGTDLIWATVGGLSISTLSNAATVTLNAGVPTAGQALTYDGTDLIWATVSGSAAWGAITGTLSTQTDLQGELDLKANLSAPSFTSGITVDATGITFSDSTVQTTAGLTTPVADGLYYPLSGNPSGFITSVPNPSANFMMANAIASLIYSQGANAYGDLSFGNVPQFITGLSTNWGITDSLATYYNVTGFSGSSYSLAGTMGAGPYFVTVNGTNSEFTI